MSKICPQQLEEIQKLARELPEARNVIGAECRFPDSTDATRAALNVFMKHWQFRISDDPPEFHLTIAEAQAHVHETIVRLIAFCNALDKIKES